MERALVNPARYWGVPTFVAVTILGNWSEAAAATLGDCKVTHYGRRYQIDFQATLNAPAAASYAVISDVANYPSIDTTIRRVQVLGRPDNQELRLDVDAYLCVLWHCARIHEVQDMSFVQYSDGGKVVANVLPQLSDFRYGKTEWQVRASGEQTVLHVVADLEPAFEIPPLIGPWLIRRTLRIEAERTAAGIERLAHR